VFTGIIEEVGSVHAVEQSSGLVRLQIRGPRVTQDAAQGDSIAVNSVCLTVADLGPDEFTADGFGAPGELALDGAGLRVAIAVAQWHATLTKALLAGAQRAPAREE
jgi:Lumazine binding domain